MSLATNVSNEAGTGAVRSTDLAKERWDLICYDSVRELARAMSWFSDYHHDPVRLVAISMDHIGRFLGGERGDVLARGWSYLAVAIQQIDCSKQEYEVWVTTHNQRVSAYAAGRFSYDLLPYYALKRISTTCHEGAVKYGEHNWYRGFQVTSLLNHAAKHHLKWLNGLSVEDDLGHSSWGYMASLYMMKRRPDMQKSLLGPGCSLTDEIKEDQDKLDRERAALKAKILEEEVNKLQFLKGNFSVGNDGPVS